MRERDRLGEARGGAATHADDGVGAGLGDGGPGPLGERDTERVERALARSKTTRDHDDLVAIVVASHRDAKNYPNLLRAFRHACDLGAELRLVCIGDGPGLEAHRRLADELGIADRVSFRPPTLDVLEAMADADMLVVASDYEGQPLVVVEALALGLPIVATAVGNIPELVGADHGTVVPARDARALGEALARVANDPRPPRPRLAPVRDLEPVLEDLSSVYGWLTSRSS